LNSRSAGVPPASATTRFPPNGGPSNNFRGKSSDAAKMAALLEPAGEAFSMIQTFSNKV
jgi:hypothetical protein